MANHAVSANISAQSSLSADATRRPANVGTALRAHLLAHSAITRVYPVRLPQKPDYPCVSFQVITSPRAHTMEGAVSIKSVVQIDCWAKTYLEAQTIATAVEEALDTFVGRMGGILKVTATLQGERQDLYEPDVDDYRVSLDFSIWHS